MIEDSGQRHPFEVGVNCVSEDEWGGDIYLPKYEKLEYDETAETPSMAYMVGYSNTISFPICVDTGAGKSLMNWETWAKINANDTLELKPQYRGFEAVNGSRINCKGSAIIQLMLMGEERNYVGYFKFYIVETLAVDALLGIDEIFRHEIRLNVQSGFACHDKAGKLKTNIVFKAPYDIGVIMADEDLGNNLRVRKDSLGYNDPERVVTKSGVAKEERLYGSLQKMIRQNEERRETPVEDLLKLRRGEQEQEQGPD